MDDSYDIFNNPDHRKAYLQQVIAFLDNYYSPGGTPPEFTISTRQLIQNLSEHFVHIQLIEPEIHDLLQRKGYKLFEVEQMNFQWGFRRNPSLPS